MNKNCQARNFSIFLTKIGQIFYEIFRFKITKNFRKSLLDKNDQNKIQLLKFNS